MTYEFTLILNRQINDEESETLRKEGCAGATFSTAPLPTNAAVTAARLDFDIDGPSLAEVIKSALAAVKTVPDLSAASLDVPPQPNGAPADGEVVDGEVVSASSNGGSVASSNGGSAASHDAVDESEADEVPLNAKASVSA